MSKNMYIGNNVYDESVLVRCDCGDHFMEIYFCSVGSNYCSIGIDWHSTTLRKYKYPNFEFLSYEDFDQFKTAIKLFTSDPTPYDEPLIYGTVVRLGVNKCKFNGSLQVNIDDFGYLRFIRCDKKNRIIWDLELHKNDIADLYQSLEKIEQKYLEFSREPFEEFSPKKE